MNWTSWLVWGFAATAVLTTLMAGSEGLGLTRMNIPHMLGTMFTPNRDRAKVYGASLHFLNGWAFSIVYVAAFHAAHRFTWWFGALLGPRPRRVRRRRRAAGDAGRPPAHGERAARPDGRAPARAARLPRAELRRAHTDLRADRARRVRRDPRRPLLAGRFQSDQLEASRRRFAGVAPAGRALAPCLQRQRAALGRRQRHVEDDAGTRQDARAGSARFSSSVNGMRAVAPARSRTAEPASSRRS